MTIPTTVSVDSTDNRPMDTSAPVKAWRPPMGWNSWDSYGTTITEEEVLANARFMAGHLKDAGWDTLVIDAGWFDPNAHAHGYSDGTTSAHKHGHYGAIFWTGSEPYELKGNIQLQSFVGIDQRNKDWTLTDLWADVPQAPDDIQPDIRIEGEGEDRVIRGIIPAHGCLWFALD